MKPIEGTGEKKKKKEEAMTWLISLSPTEYAVRLVLVD